LYDQLMDVVDLTMDEPGDYAEDTEDANLLAEVDDDSGLAE